MHKHARICRTAFPVLCIFCVFQGVTVAVGGFGPQPTIPEGFDVWVGVHVISELIALEQRHGSGGGNRQLPSTATNATIPTLLEVYWGQPSPGVNHLLETTIYWSQPSTGVNMNPTIQNYTVHAHFVLQRHHTTDAEHGGTSPYFGQLGCRHDLLPLKA